MSVVASELFALAKLLQRGLALVLEDLVEELVRFVNYHGHTTIVLHGAHTGAFQGIFGKTDEVREVSGHRVISGH